MLFWILAGLAMFLVMIFLPAGLFLKTEGMARHVGSRDEQPEPEVLVLRARRALANTQENMPFFLTLGVLALVVESTDMAQAVLGAQLFVLGRIAYTVLYLISIPWTRSVAYLVAFVGMAMMALALI